MCEVLCGQVRTALPDAGDLLSFAADRVFRGHRGGARHCLAVGGLTGVAAFCGHWVGRVHAGSLDDIAHAAVDRCGHASRSIRLGAGRSGRSWTAEGAADRHRCDDAGGQRGDALDRAARHGRELRGVSERVWRRPRGSRRRRAKTWCGWTASARSARRTRSGRVRRTRMRGSRR